MVEGIFDLIIFFAFWPNFGEILRFFPIFDQKLGKIGQNMKNSLDQLSFNISGPNFGWSRGWSGVDLFQFLGKIEIFLPDFPYIFPKKCIGANFGTTYLSNRWEIEPILKIK